MCADGGEKHWTSADCTATCLEVFRSCKLPVRHFEMLCNVETIVSMVNSVTHLMEIYHVLTYDNFLGISRNPHSPCSRNVPERKADARQRLLT